MLFHFMIVSHLLLILHKKIQFYLYVWSLKCGKRSQSSRGPNTFARHCTWGPTRTLRCVWASGRSLHAFLMHFRIAVSSAWSNSEVSRAVRFNSLTSASRVWTSDRMALSPSIRAMATAIGFRSFRKFTRKFPTLCNPHWVVNKEIGIPTCFI